MNWQNTVEAFFFFFFGSYPKNILSNYEQVYCQQI